MITIVLRNQAVPFLKHKYSNQMALAHIKVSKGAVFGK